MKRFIYILKLLVAFLNPGKVADSVNRAKDRAEFDVLLFGGH